jgi:hypothetical protein
MMTSSRALKVDIIVDDSSMVRRAIESMNGLLI